MNWLKRGQSAIRNSSGKIFKTLWSRLQAHSDPALQRPWNWAQLAFIVMPFSPLLGSFGVLFATITIWKFRSKPFWTRPVALGLGLFTLLLVLSAVLSPRPGDALLGLFNFVPFFLGFVVLSELIQSTAQLRQLAWIVACTSMPVAVIGLVQMLLGWLGNQQPFHFQLLWIIFDWQIDPRGTPTGRMSSIFFYANVLASYLVMSLALTLGLWMEAVGEGGREKRGVRSQESGGGRRQRAGGNASDGPGAAGGRNIEREQGAGDEKSGVRKIRWLPITHYRLPITHSPFPIPHSPFQNHPAGWLMAIALVDTVALILTNSRNAWAIAALSCLVLAVYYGWRWLLIAVGGITTSILGASFGPTPARDWLRRIVPAFFWARLTDELYPNRPLATLRTSQWQFALSLTQQRPWTGWGLRSFSPLYQAQTQHQLGHPHNLLLMLLCETGMPATVLLVGLVGWIVIQAVSWLGVAGWQRRSVQPGHGEDLTPNPWRQQGIMFTFLVAFLSCAGFSLFDITLFDARINWLGWMLLASIWGTTRSPTS